MPIRARWIVGALLAAVLAVPAWAGAGDVGAFLDRLEHADDDVRTFHARISYTKRMSLVGDEITRMGELAYRVNEDGTRIFAVVFDTIDMDGVRREIDERLVFDGRFLVEFNREQKMITRRELAPPGERIDPLQLGEGPIPIPIGQEAEEIERRYHAELLRFDDGVVGAARAEQLRLAETEQLKLVPRSQFADESDFTEVRIWYREGAERAVHPRLAYTVNRAGDEAFVVLINAKVNEADFDEELLRIEPPDEAGWTVQEIAGHFAAEDGGAE